jgi:uncharacterized protein HemX
MSQTSKLVLGIAVLLVIALGAYYYWHSQQASQVTASNPTEVTTLPSGSSTSDTSIEQDLSSIDSQIKASNDDNANVHTSVTAAAAQ